MSLEAMRQSEAYCRARRSNLQEMAPELHRDFLRNELAVADLKKDVDAARVARAKILREGSKKM